MTFWLRVVVLAMVSLSALAACAPAANTSVESESSAILEDVSLVANTGKPQLLDSFADW